MIKVKENQLKLPLYPEWDEENNWKTSELAVDEIDLTIHAKTSVSCTMNIIPNTITFSVLGKDMVIIDEDGIKWNKEGDMVKVKDSQELSLAFYALFNEMGAFSQKYMSSNTLLYTQNGNIHIKNGNDSNVFPITGNDNSIIQTYIDNILSMCGSIPTIQKSEPIS